jgi:sugar phosphate isomerase/epimerase
MFINLAPGAVGIQATLDESVVLAKRHGFGGIDLPFGDAQLESDPRGAARNLAESGLRWGGFGLNVDFRNEDAAYESGMNALKRHLPAVRAAGCDRCYTWLMPGHDTLDYRANFDRHARRLRPVASLLAEHGVRLGIEFVGTKTLRDRFRHAFVYNADHALELADAVGSNTGVLLDSFHWHNSGGTTDDLTGMLRGRGVYVHVNDARAGRSRDEQLDNERALPGDTGVIDLAGFVGGLRAAGYDGPVTAEPFMPELAQLPPDEAAARVGASIRRILG